MQTVNSFSFLILLAMQYLNVPYIYGGNNPLIGIDCSALVQLPLRKLKVIRDYDHSAQMIYDDLIKNDYVSSEPEMDCILFFGRSVDRISHIAIALNEELMIEAASGGPKVTLEQHAIAKQAKVEFNRIDRRNDLVASIKVTY